MPTTPAAERRVDSDRRTSDDRRAGGQLVAAFWVLDALILGLALFFAVVGGALLDSTVFAVVLIVGSVVLAIGGLVRLRNRDLALSQTDRRVRERRGF